MEKDDGEDPRKNGAVGLRKKWQSRAEVGWHESQRLED